MSVKDVGEVYFSPRKNYIWWEIDSFRILPKEKDIRIWSPPYYKNTNFSSTYNFDIKVPIGSVGLILSSTRSLDAPLGKRIRIGLVIKAKTAINCCEAEWIKLDPYFEDGYFRVLDLCKEKSLSESDRMRFFCELINEENDQIEHISEKKKENASAATNEENKGTHSEHRSSKVDEIKSQDMKKMDSAVKAIGNTRNADNVLENSKLAADEDKKQKLKNLEKFIQNFQELYVSGKHTDVIIKVKGREFKVHKAIIAARSSVFDAMFTHRLSESKSGIVPIEDCEPAVFEEFLFFIYTGRIQQLSSENAFDLYYVADKYQISELKEECVIFFKKSMTIETICDVICLSTKCNETELLNHAIDFFAKNMEEILITVKWQLFMEENPTKANELTLKALKLGFVKRKF